MAPQVRAAIDLLAEAAEPDRLIVPSEGQSAPWRRIAPAGPEGQHSLHDNDPSDRRKRQRQYARGWQSEPTTSVKQITGKGARSIGEFARDFAGAFGKR